MSEVVGGVAAEGGEVVVAEVAVEMVVAESGVRVLVLVNVAAS